MGNYTELHLWNEQVKPSAYVAEEKYRGAILEQYKVYVDLFDKSQARGPVLDSFFLTLNAAAFTLLGVLVSKHVDIRFHWWLTIPLLVLLANCYAWWRMIHSRKTLIGARYEVIMALEERLPASPMVGEWHAYMRRLQGPHGLRIGRLAGSVDEWIPISFAVLYVGGFIAILLS